jgi:hypothetical protein
VCALRLTLDRLLRGVHSLLAREPDSWHRTAGLSMVAQQTASDSKPTAYTRTSVSSTRNCQVTDDTAGGQRLHRSHTKNNKSNHTEHQDSSLARAVHVGTDMAASKKRITNVQVLLVGTYTHM